MSQVNHAHVYHLARGRLGPVGKQLAVMVMLCFIPIGVQGNSCVSGAQKEQLCSWGPVSDPNGQHPPFGPPSGAKPEGLSGRPHTSVRVDYAPPHL